MSRGSTPRRLGAAAGLAIAAATFTACGSQDAGGAPEDASVGDFCDAYVSNPAFSGSEQEPTQEEVDEFVDRLLDTGTPEDMSDSERTGFEAVVDIMRGLDVDDSEEDTARMLEEQFEDSEKDVEAFIGYAGEKCADEIMDAG